MPVVPASIVNLLGVINSASATPDQGDSGFESLLDIGASSQNNASAGNGSDNSAANALSTVQPVNANTVQVPTAFFAQAKNSQPQPSAHQPALQVLKTPSHPQQPQPDNQGNGAGNTNQNNNAAAQNNTQDTGSNVSQAQPSAAPAQDSQGNGQDNQQPAAPVAAASQDTTVAADSDAAVTAPVTVSGASAAAPGKNTKKTDVDSTDVTALVMNLLQILQTLLPQAAPAASATPSAAAADSAATDSTAAAPVAAAGTPAAATPSLSDLLASLMGQQAPATDTQNTAPATDTGATAPALTTLLGVANTTTAAQLQGALALNDTALPADPVALLKDIQSVLQQLQQALPAASADASADIAATPDMATGATVQPLLTQLKSDMKSLLQQLSPAAQASVTTQAASSDSAATAAAPVTGALDNAIDLVKAMLPHAKQTVTAAANTNTQASAPAPALPAAPAAAPATKAPAAKDTDDTSLAISAQSVSAAATQATPAPAQPTNAAPTAQAAFVSVGLDTGTGNSGSDTSGNNGNNTPQAPVITGAGAQAQQNASVGTTTFSKVMSQIVQNPVLDQITFNVKTALADGSSKIHIQLSPEDLGKLDIKLSVGADGKTGVVITADNKNTLDLLQRDSSGLTRALSDAGLTTDGGSLNFNLRGGQQEQQQQQGNQQAALTYQKAAPEEDVPTPAIISSNYVVNITQGLDISI